MIMSHLETIFLISQLITLKYTSIALKSNTAENLRKTGYIDGEFIIGALIPMHGLPTSSATSYKNPLECYRIQGPEGIQLVEAAFYAVDTINRNKNILPDIQLGITIKDECWNELIALYQTLKLIESPISRRKDSTNSPNREPKSTKAPCSQTKTNHPTLIGMIGTTSSASTNQVQNLMKLFKIPQIGYVSPSFNSITPLFYYSVVPNHYHEAFAILNIIRKFEWNYISIAYSDEYSEMSGRSFLPELVQYLPICVAVNIHIPPDSQEAMHSYALTEIFKDERARVIICFCETSIINDLYKGIQQRNKTGHFLILGINDLPINEVTLHGYEDQAHGSLMMKKKKPQLLEFDEYFLNRTLSDNNRNPWFEEYWEHRFQCKIVKNKFNNSNMSTCTGNEDLSKGYQQGTKVAHVIKSINALAHGLDEMIKNLCSNDYKNCSHLHPFDSMKYLDYLVGLNFSWHNESINLAFRGSPTIANYDIFNFQKLSDGSFAYEKVLEYTYDISSVENENSEDQDAFLYTFEYWQDLQFPGDAEYFVSSCSRPCPKGHIQMNGRVNEKLCCWSCVPCKRNEIMHNATTCTPCPEGHLPDTNKSSCVPVSMNYVQWTTFQFYIAKGLSTIGILVTLFTAYIFVQYRNTPVVKSSTRELCYFILIGLLMHHSAIFFTVAKPSTFSCTLIRIVPPLSATIVYASLLVKTNRIARLLAISKKKFPNLNPRFMTLKAQIVLTFILIAIQVCATTTCLIIDPPSVMTYYNNDEENLTIYVQCHIPINTSSVVSFVYNITLILFCTYYAFKTRNIPDNFNEAKFIGFLMYVTCLTHSVCSFVYLGSDRKMVSIGISMSVNGFSALFLLFFPKLYIILWAPERNTREHFATATGIRCIMGRTDIISNEQLLKKKFLKNDLKNFEELNGLQINSFHIS